MSKSFVVRAIPAKSIPVSGVPDDRRRVVFHQIGDRGVGERPAHGPDGRRGEDDVADQAEADQEDLDWQASGKRLASVKTRKVKTSL